MSETKRLRVARFGYRRLTSGRVQHVNAAVMPDDPADQSREIGKPWHEEFGHGQVQVYLPVDYFEGNPLDDLADRWQATADGYMDQTYPGSQWKPDP